MDVFLTVDVESYCGDYEREVEGMGKGLPYLLKIFSQYGLRATFFVEALGATRWGLAPLRATCARIMECGHEVQLHVHPVVAALDGFSDRWDVLLLHDLPTQTRLLRVGMEVLAECGVRDVTGFRAGDMAANEDTLIAMEAVGICIGSNRDFDQKSSIRTRINSLFPVTRDLSRWRRILDLPVSTMRSPVPFLDGRHRHMEIAAMGTAEMCHGLRLMAAAGYSCATILTHPGEFFRRRRGGGTTFIEKNCRRLTGLMGFLQRENNLRVLTVGECPVKCRVPEVDPPEIRGQTSLAIQRVAEQMVDRVRKLGEVHAH